MSPNASDVKFISLAEIGYTTSSLPDSPYEGVTTIWRMSLKDKKPVSVAKLQGGVADIEWSPDGSNVAILGSELWLKVGSAAPRALTAPFVGGGRDGTSLDELIVRYSHDGKYLVMVDTGVSGQAPKSAAQAMLQVRSVPDGKLVWAAPGALKGGWTTMAAWSHTSDRLFYDEALAVIQPFGVKTWDAPTKVVVTLAGGVIWYSPSVSPDDRLVAYHVESATDAKPHLEVRDLVSGSVRVLAGIRGKPFLLSDEVMIEQHYLLISGFGPPYVPGQYFVLNLKTNVETSLSATFNCPLMMDASQCSEHGPLEIWPH
ncbi:MAG: hypothetical protein E6J37_11460 [Chloroflexi bacterium]|nr:MAG: hypothetical protein E6J37_11460 [Chloroflexota bacterium]